jgi:hypothetical protein
MCQSVGAVRCAAALGRVEELATSDRFDEAVAAFARVESELALVRAKWGVTTREDGEAARAA